MSDIGTMLMWEYVGDKDGRFGGLKIWTEEGDIIVAGDVARLVELGALCRSTRQLIFLLI